MKDESVVLAELFFYNILFCLGQHVHIQILKVSVGLIPYSFVGKTKYYLLQVYFVVIE